MALTLHNLKVAKGSSKKKKRLGRGNSSGHGNYSTRGLKGQRARSGGKGGLKRLGLRPIILATPKKKGFKSLKEKNQVVNLADLNSNFKDGSLINPTTLLKVGLVKSAKSPIKILGNGDLKLKKLVFSGVAFSESVEEKIKKAESKIEK